MSLFMSGSMFVSNKRKSPLALMASRFLLFVMGFITALNPPSTKREDGKAVNNFCKITHNAGYKIGISFCNQNVWYHS